MDKTYDHQQAEQKWYKFWEENGFFKPEINPKGKPYTILIPPPNASGKMHTGNVLMIAIEDLLIRWKRMQGYAALWVPGTDHAGTETQITYEKILSKEGKSRFNFTRNEFYQNIWDFVQNNKSSIENQIREMGASVDWDRYTFTLDDKVIKTVYSTFKKLLDDDLVYKDDHMVNYCPKCGTTYSDAEISFKDQIDPLYYINYRLVDEDGYIAVATVRPEPIWADTHLAVNPKDKKHSYLTGRKVINPLNKNEMEIISDEFVNPEFGTGVVKLTPAVDKNDYEVAKKHNLPINPVLDLNGKLLGMYSGLSVIDARKKAVDDLKESIEKIDDKYSHSVAYCKAGHMVEPMILPNWFIKVDDPKKSFKKPALEVIKSGKLKIFPKWQENKYTIWLEEMRDWPISRQNVWGIRIPMWYPVDGHEGRIFVSFIDKDNSIHHGPIRQWLERGYTFEQIESGLQRVIVLKYDAKTNNPKPIFSLEKPTIGNWIPETDTFDTWFSSGQWPLVTLGYPDSSDFKKFYPTDVLETGWEIIRLWVSRMVMFGIYLTGESPFHAVYLHGMVRALDGRKMSKSLGNVINPEDYIKEFGVDSLRLGLISGTANGKDFSFPRDKVIAYKHFSNKIWNMTRFILMMVEQYGKEIPKFSEKLALKPEDKEVLKNLDQLIKQVNDYLEKFRFADAGETIYQFMWHEIADIYIEQVKNREDKDVALSTLIYIHKTSLELLHPFMPFITEELWQKLPHLEKSIMITKWPKTS